MNSSDGNLGALIQIRRMGVTPQVAARPSHSNRSNLRGYRIQSQVQIGPIRLCRESSSHRMAIRATMGLQAHCLMTHQLIDMVIPGPQVHKCR